MKSLFNLFFIFSLLLFISGCKKIVLEPSREDFNVKTFISTIKSYNVNAEYNENIIPTDTTSIDKPFVSVQSWVIKGKDILMNITIPEDVEELYFTAENSQVEYMGLNFSGQNQNNAIGYYQLPLNNISNQNTSSGGLRDYQIVLSSNKNIQIDKFDLIVSYKKPVGYSNKATVPVDVINIAPYQENLKVGFRPLSGYTYTIEITTPTGAKIEYSYNKNTGIDMLDNSLSPNSTLSYDSGLDFKWIDFEDPDFGAYTMKVTIQIDITGGSQYIYLYLAIVTEGIIEQVSLDADVQQTGQNAAVGTANIGFSYFEEFAKVEVERIICTIIEPANIQGQIQTEFTGMVQHPFNPTKPGTQEPDIHLPIMFNDVLHGTDMNLNFILKNITVLLKVNLKIPENFNLNDLNENWELIEAPQGTSNNVLEPFGIGQAYFKNPSKGGIYKVLYRPTENTPYSEVNIMLPLASPEVKDIVQSDLAKANSFATKVNNQYPGGFWNDNSHPPLYYDLNDLYAWFSDNFHGDYIGRPNSLDAQTIWYYNQVNDLNYRGAICTWFGIPTRLSDINYFLAGYTMKKINVPDPTLALAQIFAGTPWDQNDIATQLSFVAGTMLATNQISYVQMKGVIMDMYDDTEDGKNKTLWPNFSYSDNYVGSYPNVPSSFNPNTMMASPCYTNPNFELE